MPQLSRDLAAHLAAFTPDGARFGVKREKLERGLRNRQQELRLTPNP